MIDSINEMFLTIVLALALAGLTMSLIAVAVGAVLPNCGGSS